ncbi:hypothetical protein [Aliivibrio fischeri]
MIEISNDVKAPFSTKSLLQMLVDSGEAWPRGATCATQERDGEILFWNAPISQVKQAREKACLHKGLIPLIGVGNQVGVIYCSENNQPVVALDWKVAVITLEQFINQA